MAKKKGAKQKPGLGKIIGISAAMALAGVILGFGIQCIPAVDNAIHFGADTQVEQSVDAETNTNTDANNVE